MGDELEPNDGKQFDVGVLLVHGIGQQQPGRAIVGFVEALVAAFGADPARNLVAMHTATRLRGSEPAEAQLMLSWDGTEAGASPLSLNVREAHWADAFYPAKPLAVIKWILWVGPLTLVTRCIESIDVAFRRWHRHPLHWWRIVGAFAALVLFPPAAVALVLVIGTLSLVRPLIPIQSVKDAVGRIQIVLSQVLGDSYLYLASTTDAAAIQTVVRDGLEELAARSRRVVLCAHSQGAQVAVDAIAASPHPPHSLVTYGAGIGQLDWLRQVLRNKQSAFLIGAAIWLGVLAAAVGAVILMVGLQNDRFGLAFFVLVVTGLYYVIPLLSVRGLRFLSSLRRDRVLGPPRELAGVTRWTDLAASADPVSGQPVVRQVYSNVTSAVVVNGNNLTSDHTAYLGNQPEVMSVIASEVADAGSQPGLAAALVVPPDEITRRHEAGRHRTSARLFALALAAYGVTRLWPRRTEHYETVRGWLLDLWVRLPKDATWSVVPLDAVVELVVVGAGTVVCLGPAFLACRLRMRDTTSLGQAAWFVLSGALQVAGLGVGVALMRVLDQPLGTDLLGELWAWFVYIVGSGSGLLIIGVTPMGRWAGRALGPAQRVLTKFAVPDFRTEATLDPRVLPTLGGIALLASPIAFLFALPHLSATSLDSFVGILILVYLFLALGGLATSLVIKRSWAAWVVGILWVCYWVGAAVLTWRSLG